MFVALLLAACTAGSVREKSPDTATSGSSTGPTGVGGSPIRIINVWTNGLSRHPAGREQPARPEARVRSAMAMGGSGSTCTRGASSARPTTGEPGRTALSRSSSRGGEASMATSGLPADDWTRTPLLPVMGPRWLRPRRLSIHGGHVSDFRLLGSDGPRRQLFADVCHESHLPAPGLTDWTLPRPFYCVVGVEPAGSTPIRPCRANEITVRQNWCCWFLNLCRLSGRLLSGRSV